MIAAVLSFTKDKDLRVIGIRVDRMRLNYVRSFRACLVIRSDGSG